MKTTVSLLCAICLNEGDGETSGHWVSLAACGHLYHSGCIKRWTSPPRGSGIRKSNLCPTCRAGILHPGGNTSLTRFTKLIFDGEPIEHPTDVSSSPAKDFVTAAAAVRKRRAIVDDDEEEDEERGNEAEEEDLGTESESDEENSRPARRFSGGGGNAVAGPSRLAGAVDASGSTESNHEELASLRSQLRDLKEAQRSSRDKIAHLEHELAVQSEREQAQLSDLQEQIQEAQDERHASDQRVRDINNRIKEEKEITKKLKEEKKQLNKSLRAESERLGKFREQVSRLTTELSKLKESSADLKTKHDAALQMNKEIEAEAESRGANHERVKNTVQRLLDTKTTYENKLNGKREKISELQAEVAALRAQLGIAGGNGDNATSANGKGKGKAKNQDENLTDPKVFAEAHSPADISKFKRKRVITVDEEDSLMVLDDHHGTGGGDEDDIIEISDFSDLDAGLPGLHRTNNTSKPLAAKKLSSSSLNLKPISSSDSAAGGKGGVTVSRFFKPMTAAGQQQAQEQGRKLQKSNSEKWTDMALGLGGKGNKSGGTAVGAKKRVKTGF